jgi:CxxC-x17-CxxC domain-containing protein
LQPKVIDSRTGQAQHVCVDCGDPFERTPEEIAGRRGSGMPMSARCPACRLTRRDEWNARVFETLMTGDLRGQRRVSPGPPDGAERLYPAICSGCRRSIRLPFKPRLDRPVFCRFCHDARNGR